MQHPPDLDEHRSLRHAIGEYEAARRRVERDAVKVAEETRIRLVSDLLPVMDSLDRAGASADEACAEGMTLVRTQLESVLRGYGLERYDAIGQPFDPHVHEAMDVVPVADPAADGVVIAQWRAGYRVAGRVLRAAQVQVGRYQGWAANRRAM